jgi:serine/threonine-protein kinase
MSEKPIVHQLDTNLLEPNMSQQHATPPASPWSHLMIGATDSPRRSFNSITLEPLAGASIQDTFAEVPPTPEEFALGAMVATLPLRGSEESGMFVSKGTLGEGGMGIVSLARQTALHRDVAIKRVRDDQVDTKTTRLLLHESFVAGTLEHPATVPVHMLCRDENNQPELVMRRVEGVSWEDLLNAPGHPIWKRRKTWSQDPLVGHLEILMELCQVVDFAHHRGFVHRDIKPENVMIGAFGEIFLLDWGLAAPLPHRQLTEEEKKLLCPASFGGTPAYMAPEMLMGKLEHIDQRTDVFLLGSCLHRVLTGHVRHLGHTVEEALFSAAVCHPYEYAGDVPEELAAIANRAMHREPAQRFQDASELRQALADYLSHIPSLSLTRTALDRLQQIETLVQNESTGLRLPQIIRRLFSECRFGLMQALESWSGNQVAQDALRRAIETMVAYEIRQENVENAAALFGELAQPPQQLAQDLQALHHEIQAKEAEHQRMKKLAFEMDLSFGADTRFQMLGWIGVAIGVLAVVWLVFYRLGMVELTYPRLLATNVFGAAALGGFAWFWRDQLLRTLIGRNFVLFLVVSMCLLAMGRFGAMVLSVPIPFCLLYEMLLFTVVVLAAAVLFSMWMIRGVAVCALCFLVGAFVPAIIPELFVFLTFVMWFLPIYAIRRKIEEGGHDA